MLPAFTIGLLIARTMAGVDAPEGYTLLEGELARQALAGNLLRIVVREIVRADLSHATVYRDVDYPVREGAAGPEKDPAEDDDQVDGATNASDADDASGDSRTYAVWVLLGAEYEDPPARGSPPSSHRLRAPGPASVWYEWDQYRETGGRGDEVLRLELDFSGTQVIIRRGYWQMEAEAGEVAATKETGYDFICEQGAYGTALGRLATRDLWRGAPEEITVTLTRHRPPGPPDGESAADEENDDDTMLSPEGTGTYRLKRKLPDAV